MLLPTSASASASALLLLLLPLYLRTRKLVAHPDSRLEKEGSWEESERVREWECVCVWERERSWESSDSLCWVCEGSVRPQSYRMAQSFFSLLSRRRELEKKKKKLRHQERESEKEWESERVREGRERERMKKASPSEKNETGFETRRRRRRRLSRDNSAAAVTSVFRILDLTFLLSLSLSHWLIFYPLSPFPSLSPSLSAPHSKLTAVFLSRAHSKARISADIHSIFSFCECVTHASTLLSLTLWVCVCVCVRLTLAFPLTSPAV